MRFSTRRFPPTPGEPCSEQNIVWRLFKEFWLFFKRDRKWWLVPLILLLLLLGCLIMFSSSAALAPFMYPFM